MNDNVTFAMPASPFNLLRTAIEFEAMFQDARQHIGRPDNIDQRGEFLGALLTLETGTRIVNIQLQRHKITGHVMTVILNEYGERISIIGSECREPDGNNKPGIYGLDATQLRNVTRH